MRDTPFFEFIGGSLSMDFVDTVSGRGGNQIERLFVPADLDAWLAAAGLGHGKPPASTTDLKGARLLRDAIYRCGIAVGQARLMTPKDVERINAAAAIAPLRPQLTHGVLSLVGHPFIPRALSTIASDALDILVHVPGERLRICPDCQMMFIDRSRPGKRIWCSSSSGCGNRDKVRRHRSRYATEGQT